MKSKHAQTISKTSKSVLPPLSRRRTREAQIQTDDETRVKVFYNEELPNVSEPVDACTQLDEGTLFDFDVEVEPFLEILVGRAISEARDECRRDIYLEKLAKKRRDFERKRDEQETLLKHLAQIEERKREERKRTCEQQIAILSISESALSKLSAHKQARTIFGYVCDHAVDKLKNARVFEPPQARYIRTTYIPVLMQDAMLKLRKDSELNHIRYDYLPALLDAAKAKASPN